MMGIWGIGLHEKDTREVPPGQWPGLNLLGKVLVSVRQANNIRGSGERRSKLLNIDDKAVCAPNAE